MQVQLIDRAPTRIAYRRDVGPYGPSIHAFWMNVVAPWIQTHGLHQRPRYGISHDDPSITDPAQRRYDAAVEVDAAFAPGAGAFATTLPGGRMRRCPSSAAPPRSARPGRACCAMGWPAAACNSMHGPASGTTRPMRATSRRAAALAATS